tara:strand:+ start:1206 stop:1364 length:159 start_codon:yes stop_codon:yes gene_type:complete
MSKKIVQFEKENEAIKNARHTFKKFNSEVNHLTYLAHISIALDRREYKDKLI